MFSLAPFRHGHVDHVFEGEGRQKRLAYPIAPVGASVPYNHPAFSVSNDGTWFVVGSRTGSRADLMLVEGLR